jgi:hypothetical protein
MKLGAVGVAQLEVAVANLSPAVPATTSSVVDVASPG